MGESNFQQDEAKCATPYPVYHTSRPSGYTLGGIFYQSKCIIGL